ncbi:hypothetical protein [Sporosarcina sp. E16_8]|uniref:hypothetical protein n=1 Tax=Sporosarcina sp. E16_8 TaxID=2789295 RepID=UPI001A923EEF|nr:hypothetical protein [Sporosarcina sp. E16_8]MBO0589150.1 hypothetical protein [Sporosarcina sp. E16_8]
MVGNNRDDVGAKLTKLQHQTKTYLSEIKKMVDELNEPAKMIIVSYFTYSLNVSHDPEQESLCLGSYHIHNLGNQPITNPSVCIKVSQESPFSFSGRYVYADFKQSLKVADGWERTNEKTNKEEFWLRPLGKSSVEPNETISFSNFQITWSPKESYAGSIMGTTYSDQMKDGIAVINPINLNGTVRIQGVENE